MGRDLFGGAYVSAVCGSRLFGDRRAAGWKN